MTSKAMPLPVENDTCVHNRSVGNILPPEGASFDELMDWYAGEILGQIPCMRMMDRQVVRSFIMIRLLRGLFIIQ